MIKFIVTLTLLPLHLLMMLGGVFFGLIVGIASAIKGFGKLHQSKKEELQLNQRVKRVKKHLKDKGVKVGV